jgi:hypothetical protein
MLKFSDYVWVRSEDVRLIRLETRGAVWVVKLLLFSEGHVETYFDSRPAAEAHADRMARDIQRVCSGAITPAKTPLHERRAQAAGVAPRIVRTAAATGGSRSVQPASRFADDHFRKSAERMTRTADDAVRTSATFVAAAGAAGLMD